MLQNAKRRKRCRTADVPMAVPNAMLSNRHAVPACNPTRLPPCVSHCCSAASPEAVRTCPELLRKTMAE